MKKYAKTDIGPIILKKLSELYPDAEIALEFTSDMELFVATILSAQCTDKKVNQVTRRLFLKYRSAAEYANADPAALENAIRAVGLYRSKAKNIIQSARIIEQKLGGKIPRDMDGLIALPGVGRKTANVILYNAFGKNEGIAVDTHVKRLSRRLGLTQEMAPEKIERQLKMIFPREKWGQVNHLLIAHGRSTCAAQNPKCEICGINSFCLCYKKNKQNCL